MPSPPREYFRHGRFEVTGHLVRARNRSIQLSTIEGVDVHRPLFHIALAGCAGLAGFGLVFGDLLYPVETVAVLALGIAGLVLSWQVGTLRVFSKRTGERGWSVHWWIKPLFRMREAIETAMHELPRKHRRNQGGGSGHHDDQDDSDEDND